MIFLLNSVISRNTTKGTLHLADSQGMFMQFFCKKQLSREEDYLLRVRASQSLGKTSFNSHTQI